MEERSGCLKTYALPGYGFCRVKCGQGIGMAAQGKVLSYATVKSTPKAGFSKGMDL
jgi:hypothetical protein